MLSSKFFRILEDDCLVMFETFFTPSVWIVNIDMHGNSFFYLVCENEISKSWSETSSNSGFEVKKSENSSVLGRINLETILKICRKSHLFFHISSNLFHILCLCGINFWLSLGWKYLDWLKFLIFNLFHEYLKTDRNFK